LSLPLPILQLTDAIEGRKKQAPAGQATDDTLEMVEMTDSETENQL